MRAGNLRHKISLEVLTTSKNSYGEDVETWTHSFYERASILALRGTEYIEAQQMQNAATYKIRMRYSSNTASLSPASHRANHGGTIYVFESCLPDDRRRELVCMAMEDVA